MKAITKQRYKLFKSRYQQLVCKNCHFLEVIMVNHHENVIPNWPFGIRFYYSNVLTSGYVPMHWHSSIEIVCVISGELKFKVNSKIITLHNHEFIIIPSGAIHDVTNQPNQAYVLQIPLSVISPYYPEASLVQFNNTLKDSPSYLKIYNLFSQLGIITQNDSPGNRFDFASKLFMLLKLIFTDFVNDNNNPQPSSPLKSIIIDINSNYQKPISVSHLAKKHGYNASYLSRTFKKEVGISANDYIYMVKLSNLYNEIKEHPQVKLYEQMTKVGITNQRKARAMFLQMFGMLPKDFRHEVLNN